MSNQEPIGVFDSGVGGLTVVASLRRALPNENILYLGDTARLPYGTKSPDTVIKYTRRNVDFLVRRGVKAVVVACNTASALAVDQVEAPVPIWGVIEPGAAEAARVTKRKVGVLATQTTVDSGAYPDAIHRIRPELEVMSQACPLFVPLVEEGWQADPITAEIARRYVGPLLKQGVDTLLLGCTHYPLLAKTLHEVAGPAVRLINSADVTSDRVANSLNESNLAIDPLALEGAKSRPQTTEDKPSSIHLCMTDAGHRFALIAERILGVLKNPPEHVDV